MTTAAATVAPKASNVLKGILVVASETLLVVQTNDFSTPYTSMSAADILVYGAEDKVFPSPQDITLSRVSKRNFRSTSVEFNAANADSRLLKKGKKKNK